MPIRKRAGIITILLWIAAILGWLYNADQLWEGAFIRTAVVMTLLWSAWPQLARLPRWLYIAVPVIVVTSALQPRVLLFLIPALLLYGIIRPKKRE